MSNKNKIETRFFLIFWFFASVVIVIGQEPDPNYYARTPLTPEYGISDYFELTSEKVHSIKKLPYLKQKALPITLHIRGKWIYTNFSELNSSTFVEVSLFNLQGRMILNQKIKPQCYKGFIPLLGIPDSLNRSVLVIVIKAGKTLFTQQLFTQNN